LGVVALKGVEPDRHNEGNPIKGEELLLKGVNKGCRELEHKEKAFVIERHRKRPRKRPMDVQGVKQKIGRLPDSKRMI